MPLIDHEKNFIFVHIYCTGGTTFRIASKALGFNYEVVNDEHGRLMDVPHCKEYFSFAIVRNPYNWMESVYRAIVTRPDHKYHKQVKDLNYYDFLCWYIDVYGYRQSDFLSSCDDFQLVNYVGRFELLSLSMMNIFNMYGVGDESFLFPRSNQTKKIPIIVEDKTVAVINHYFDCDFKHFNYKKEEAFSI